MNTWLLPTAVLVLMVATSWAQRQQQNPLKKDYQADFSWRAYKKVFSEVPQNLVLAPYSLRKIFQCLLNVTNPQGESAPTLDQELGDVFKLQRGNKLASLVDLRYASEQERLFTAKQLQVTTLAVVIGRHSRSKRFDECTSNCMMYNGLLEPANLKLMTRVANQAMRNITGNLEKKFFANDDIAEDWDFFVADSWRFKGLWKFNFEQDHFTTCNFYANKTSKGLVKFMYLQENLKYAYLPKFNLKAVELPFHEGSPWSCMLLMPDVGPLESMVQGLSHARFMAIHKSLELGKTEVKVPRFGFKSQLYAKSLLERMGLNVPFEGKVYQVFEQQEQVALGDIIQKVSVEFSPEGEKTAQRYVDRVLGNRFIAHQPFVFIIYDRISLVPVLIGQYLTPRTPKNARPEEDDRMCDNLPRGFN